MLPIGSRRRRVLYQSTHSRVANSAASMLRHGPRRRITSVLNRPLIVSASALSYESPTLPTEGSIPASSRRSVYRIATYWVDSSDWSFEFGWPCSTDGHGLIGLFGSVSG